MLYTNGAQGSPPPSVRPFHIAQALRADTDADPDLHIELAVLLTRPTPLFTPEEQRFLLLWGAGWSVRAAHAQAGLKGNPARDFRHLLQRLADEVNRE